MLRRYTCAGSAPLPVIGLAGEHQRYNASLALQLCNSWHQSAAAAAAAQDAGASVPATKAGGGGVAPVAAPFELVPHMKEGVAKSRWPGRNQIYRAPGTAGTFLLDGAHTAESCTASAEWCVREEPLSLVCVHTLSGCGTAKVNSLALRVLSRSAKRVRPTRCAGARAHAHAPPPPHSRGDVVPPRRPL